MLGDCGLGQAEAPDQIHDPGRSAAGQPAQDGQPRGIPEGPEQGGRGRQLYSRKLRFWS